MDTADQVAIRLESRLANMVRSFRADRDIAYLSDEFFAAFAREDGFDLVCYFLTDDLFEFNLCAMSVPNSQDVCRAILDDLTEMGLVGEILSGRKDYVLVRRGTLADPVVMTPMLNASGINGLVIYSSSNYSVLERCGRLLLVAGSLLGSGVEQIRSNARIRSQNELLEQRIHARTLLLEQNKFELRLLLDSIVTGVFICDRDSGIIADANEAACTVLETSRERLLGSTIDAVVALPGDSLVSMMRLRDHPGRLSEARLRRGANNDIPILLQVTQATLGSQPFVVVSFVDISDRKRTEQELLRTNVLLEDTVKERTTELLESVKKLQEEIKERQKIQDALEKGERMLALIFETVNIGLCLTNEKGTLLRVNNAFCQMLGTFEDALLGRSIYEFITMEDLETVFRRYTLMVRDQGAEHLSLTVDFLDSSKTRKTYVLNSTKFIGVDNSVLVVSAVNDISEHKKAEREMMSALAKEKELSDLKSSFISMVSHEFRTPLTTILSYTQLLQRYMGSWTPEQREKYLKNIEAAVERITNMLNDILLVGKFQHQAVGFEPSSIDVVELTHKIIDEFVLPDPESHAFKTDVPTGPLLAMIDEKLFRHILSNLISNAIKYSPRDSVIEIQVLYNSEMLEFRVKDHGIGIPARNRKHLFEEFRRGDNVGNVPGTGLGMAIVKRSVDIHGGTIDVVSNEGEGSEFIVRLPLKAEEQ